MDLNRLKPSASLSAKQLKRLPVNLRKKAKREARNLAGLQLVEEPNRKRQREGAKKQQKKIKKKKIINNNFERAEHNAMLAATAEELQHILEDHEEIADVPYDVTPVELMGQIAIAEHRATTVYVQRDGLSTLQIVLPQRSPTIAQLKNAIATTTLAQLKRRQREHEQQRQRERQRRRLLAEVQHNNDEDDVNKQAEQFVERTVGAQEMNCFNGELVNSAQRNGHQHRALVSWRFLWRCFALYNVDTNQPIDDNVDSNSHSNKGRTTLTALGINNGANLKFVHRIKYFGRRRQN